jgi:hypothetical protein
MKIIEDTDFLRIYGREVSVTDTDETNAFMLFNRKNIKKKIDLDAVNNISKFDGVEWFMVAHSVDRNGDITDDIDPCGLMFDDGIYCVYAHIFV